MANLFEASGNYHEVIPKCCYTCRHVDGCIDVLECKLCDLNVNIEGLCDFYEQNTKGD